MARVITTRYTESLSAYMVASKFVNVEETKDS